MKLATIKLLIIDISLRCVLSDFIVLRLTITVFAVVDTESSTE